MLSHSAVTNDNDLDATIIITLQNYFISQFRYIITYNATRGKSKAGPSVAVSPTPTGRTTTVARRGTAIARIVSLLLAVEAGDVGQALTRHMTKLPTFGAHVVHSTAPIPC